MEADLIVPWDFCSFAPGPGTGKSWPWYPVWPSLCAPMPSRGSNIIIKMAKVKNKERIVKATRETQLVTYKGALIRLSADFSTETF